MQHFDLIREKGGNSVRLYTTNYADALLDEAQRQGLTVTLGLWMKPPYEKFDYYDPKAIEEQKQAVYRQVQRYKNHPALLMWNLGNELDNHTRDFKVYQIVNETARMIHELDPNHPITTSVTDGIYFVPAISKLCPEINLLIINVFYKLAILPKRLADAGWTGPYVIGEFGGQGWWEVPLTGWGGPLDQSGSAKAELAPDTDYPASVSAIDPDGDSLRVQWRITRDVDEFHTLPQNRTAPEAIAGTVRRAAGLTALVHTPAARGAYRLLVDVYDGKGSVTGDSFPFFVGTPDHPELGIHMYQ